MEKPRGLVAIPCSGDSRINNPVNHLYQVEQLSRGKVVGFMTPDEVDQAITKGRKIVKGNSHASCPACSMHSEGIGTLEDYEQAIVTDPNEPRRKHLLHQIAVFRRFQAVHNI